MLNLPTFFKVVVNNLVEHLILIQVAHVGDGSFFLIQTLLPN